MLHFIPPPQEKKKKKPQGEREAYEVEADVSQIYRYSYKCIHVQNVAGYFCLEIFFAIFTYIWAFFCFVLMIVVAFIA